MTQTQDSAGVLCLLLGQCPVRGCRGQHDSPAEWWEVQPPYPSYTQRVTKTSRSLVLHIVPDMASEARTADKQ